MLGNHTLTSPVWNSEPASPVLETVHDPHLEQSGIRMDVLRLDRIHPTVNGNKWYKLKHNLEQARRQGYRRLLSFGGAYSNHLRALAAAARLAGMETVGIVRGEIVQPLNPVLDFARQQGMILQGVSRSDYRQKQETEFIARLRKQFGDFYLIPEGGSNRLGVEGCADIVADLTPVLVRSLYPKSVLAVACGTGATLAGLIRGVVQHRLPVECLGIAVLKGGEFLQSEVQQWLDPQHAGCYWRIEHRYHGGGYARSTPELSAFMAAFSARTGIAVEPVYTGKLVYGLYQLIEQEEIVRGSRIIWLHTGGIYQPDC